MINPGAPGIRDVTTLSARDRKNVNQIVSQGGWEGP